MSEGLGGAVTLLERAVDAVLAERPVELPGPQALARCTALLITQERLGAAALAAVSHALPWARLARLATWLVSTAWHSRSIAAKSAPACVADTNGSEAWPY